MASSSRSTLKNKKNERVGGGGVAGGAKAGVRSAIVTEGVSEYFSVTETAQRPLQEGLKKDTSVEQTAHFKPDLLVNKISLFIGIVISLDLQAALNLSSHGIAFFFLKHTKTYVHLSTLSVNSKYVFSFEIPLMIFLNMQIIHTIII